MPNGEVQRDPAAAAPRQDKRSCRRHTGEPAGRDHITKSSLCPAGRPGRPTGTLPQKHTGCSITPQYTRRCALSSGKCRSPSRRHHNQDSSLHRHPQGLLRPGHIQCQKLRQDNGRKDRGIMQHRPNRPAANTQQPILKACHTNACFPFFFREKTNLASGGKRVLDSLWLITT